jgi:hypothetical protein
MLRAHCSSIGGETLIWPSDLRWLQNTVDGIIVRYRCTCGEIAEMLTGGASETRVSRHVSRVC